VAAEAIAAQVPEPNAMTLATVASNLRPSTRVVLVKGYDERGSSGTPTTTAARARSWPATRGRAAVPLGRAGAGGAHRRPRGEDSAEESDAYFASRPLDSRIGAWASPQSQVIPGRSVLVANARKYGAQFLLQPAAPAALGRLPAGAGRMAVLAGAQEPAA
jgi:pyridoxamine 5'-phosphate oxidase